MSKKITRTEVQLFVESHPIYEKYDNLLKNEQINFKQYWKRIQPLYNKYHIQQIKKYNYLNYFKILFKDKKFFEDIRNYMESVNWTWNDNDVPTIYKLKSNCLELFRNVMFRDSVNNFCSSGGFKVGYYNQSLIIQFGEYHNMDKIIFEKKITINDIRKLKLEKITK